MSRVNRVLIDLFNVIMLYVFGEHIVKLVLFVFNPIVLIIEYNMIKVTNTTKGRSL